MQKVTIKFPDKVKFNKFLEYFLVSRCVVDDENLLISCLPNAKEIEIAVNVFNAEVIE